MTFTDISYACFEGADCVVGIVAGVDICDLSVIIIQSLSKNYADDWKIMIKPTKILCAFRIWNDCQSGAP